MIYIRILPDVYNLNYHTVFYTMLLLEKQISDEFNNIAIRIRHEMNARLFRNEITKVMAKT